MGKSTISMAIFNSKLLVYQRVHLKLPIPAISHGMIVCPRDDFLPKIDGQIYFWNLHLIKMDWLWTHPKKIFGSKKCFVTYILLFASSANEKSPESYLNLVESNIVPTPILMA